MVEMSYGGTGNFRNFQISRKQRTTSRGEPKFSKRISDFEPEFPEILVEWKVPRITSPAFFSKCSFFQKKYQKSFRQLCQTVDLIIVYGKVSLNVKFFGLV